MSYEILRLTDRPELKETAAVVPRKMGNPPAYLDSMEECLAARGPVPQWYAAVDSGTIIGGLGVIENDFHPRKDLSPNVCAVYTEEARRREGIAGALLRFACADFSARGIDTLYLVTDHTSFYERYGWEYFCPVQVDGDPGPSMLYIHREPASRRGSREGRFDEV